jgi:hypothetical protein
MEVEGKVKLINPRQDISASFSKREIVVTTPEQYPQHIMVEFTQDKCDLLDNYKPGDDVKISINLRGREWINPQGEAKYFNTIQGWRIEKVKNEQAAPAQQVTKPQQQPAQQVSGGNEEHDDLPF